MKTLIVDLLNYSKLSSSDEPYESISLNDVIAEVLEDLEMIIQEKGAEINVELLPQVIANRGQMRQVFQNLIYNALKFSRKGINPVIRIGNEENFDAVDTLNKPMCTFSIKDNGIGFNQKHADNIFSLFKRLHSKDSFEGSGIGLSITKKIIEKHHGTIVAKSQEDNGAAFIISLPVN
jgi:light-regulated signal transduction histidine kinase (bacteriophytochrome)